MVSLVAFVVFDSYTYLVGRGYQPNAVLQALSTLLNALDGESFLRSALDLHLLQHDPRLREHASSRVHLQSVSLSFED